MISRQNSSPMVHKNSKALSLSKYPNLASILTSPIADGFHVSLGCDKSGRSRGIVLRFGDAGSFGTLSNLPRHEPSSGYPCSGGNREYWGKNFVFTACVLDCFGGGSVFRLTVHRSRIWTATARLLVSNALTFHIRVLLLFYVSVTF